MITNNYNLNTCNMSKFNKLKFTSTPSFSSNKLKKENDNKKTNYIKPAATAGGCLIAIGSFFAAIKNKDFMKSFNKIFRPNKNFLIDISYKKGGDLRQNFKDRFIHNVIRPIKNDPKKTGYYPFNGYLICGPESKAKDDFFEWTVKEMEKAGVEILDPNPGGKTKYEHLSKLMHNMFYGENSPQKVQEEFQKNPNAKFKALVLRNVDELGQPPNAKYFEQYPDNLLLNDAPDTNNSVEKFGLLLCYKAKDDAKLHPATIRSGRIDIRRGVMPYDDEPLQTWINYVEYEKNHTKLPSTAVRLIETTKKIFKKRPKEEYKAILPHLEYQVPYQGIRLEDSLKKWKNWIEYMGSRKGVTPERRMYDFQSQLIVLANKNTYNTENAKKLAENPKYQAILKMMTDKILEQAPELEKRWIVEERLIREGMLNRV